MVYFTNLKLHSPIIMSNHHQKIITIDGPAGAGKSTVAKRLAQKLNISYLDTGAMYRALTLKAMKKNINLENEDDLAAMARQTHIDLEKHEAGIKVILDGNDVSNEIRTVEVTNKTFNVAQKPSVREIMVEWQRIFGSKKGTVVEGRDVGTVVFPKAGNKFYLDANIDERSRRRAEELRDKGNDIDVDKLKVELAERDNKDLTRSVGPLRKADDAVFIDSTHLTIDEVIDEMIKHIKNSRDWRSD